jgi:hypothetical protein
MHSGSTLPSMIQLLDILVISIQLQLCFCQYCFFQNTENEAWFLLVPETPRTPVAAWHRLETNQTSTTWLKGSYNAVWKTWVIYILSCSDFVDRKPSCQPSGVNSADRTSSVALHVWPDTFSRHWKESHSHCALYCCVVFTVETLRECESRMRQLSCAVLSCLTFTLPWYCPNGWPDIS